MKCGFLRISSLTALNRGDSVTPNMANPHSALSRRERQIMDILYAKQRATAAQVMESLADPPGYSAVRTLLATLESKGYVRHERDGAKYVFIPKLHPEKAGQSAISHLIQTFFKG